MNNETNNKESNRTCKTKALITSSPLSEDSVRDISGELNALLADVLALYLKTKKFHWQMSGSYFRDCYLRFDEQGDQIYTIVDPIFRTST